MRRLAALLAFLALLAPPASGEEVIAGLSQAQITISTGFSGSEILVFGAVKREAPIPETPLDVIVTISGPSVPVTVRKKERRLGIWVNTQSLELPEAPSFYAVASTRPLDAMLTPADDALYGITLDYAIRRPGDTELLADPSDFVDALVRIRSRATVYQIMPGAVELAEQTLFRTAIALPSNLIEGNYTTRILLSRNGSVIDSYETVIGVQKVGLERWVYSLAHERPLIYGLLSITIAIVAGWGASALFRYFLRN